MFLYTGNNATNIQFTIIFYTSKLFNVALYIIVMFMSAWVYLAMKKAGVLSGAEMEVMETKKRLMITVQSDGNKLEKYLSTMK